MSVLITCYLHFRFECQVTGEPEPKVTWFANGREMYPSKRIGIKYEQGRCVLTLMQVTQEDSGDYTCNGHNMLGEATTKCTLIVKCK